MISHPRGKHRLRVFQNRVLRRIFGQKRKKQDGGENYISNSFIICTVHQIL
jgi:hypothetical protein